MFSSSSETDKRPLFLILVMLGWLNESAVAFTSCLLSTINEDKMIWYKTEYSDKIICYKTEFPCVIS